MGNPLRLDVIDGRLLALRDLVRSEKPYPTVADATRQFIEDHAHKSPGPKSLFQEDWEHDWNFVHFGVDVEPFHNTFVLDVDGLSDIQKDALDGVCVAMLRFLLNRDSVEDTKKHREQLRLVLRTYLSRRGHEVGGSSRRGRPRKKVTKQRADFAHERINQGLLWPEIAEQYVEEHPEDEGATADVIRRAHEREYPA